MITSQKINVWMQDPTHLQEVESKKIQKLAKEFPYFSVGQLFNQIKHQESIATVVSMYNLHPVKVGQLQAKATDSFKILRINNDVKEEQHPTIVQTEDKIDDIKLDADEALDAIIKENLPIADYFSQEIVDEINNDTKESNASNGKSEENAVLVVMSYTEWLKFLTKKSQEQKEEAESKSALRALWQKEKLAQALEEETDEIPEDVFEMAVNSISKNEEIASESLAEVYIRQNKKAQAINMYKKLSLLYPEKNTYFALKIEKLQKEL